MLKSNKKIIFIVAALFIISFVGSTSAYFTGTNQAENTFSIGKVKIDLTEPLYDEHHGAEYVMIPGESVYKDPIITNNGDNDAYVFMKVSIPKASVIVLDENGERITEEGVLQELFTYYWNNDWEPISSQETADEDEDLYQTHILAYANEDGECITLSPGSVTSALFRNTPKESSNTDIGEGVITFKHVLEGQDLSNDILNMDIKAYAIQADNVSGTDESNMFNVWNILTNQSKDIEDAGLLEDYPVFEIYEE